MNAKEQSASRVLVYVFRDPHFSHAGNTLVTAAPAEAVVAVYGGNGLKQEGLSAVFGGFAIYGHGLIGRRKRYLAVWGERKASRFRQSLRNAGMDVEVIKSPPPGKLLFWATR